MRPLLLVDFDGVLNPFGDSTVSVILVTGGTGALGRFVVEELHTQGHQAVVLSRQASKAAVGIPVAGTLLDGARMVDVVKQRGVTHVIHLAALVGAVAENDVGAAINTNGRGTLNVLEAARQYGVARVVYMSTKAVYGDIGGRHGPPRYERIREDDLPLLPVSAYGVSKLAGEGLAAVPPSVRTRCRLGPGRHDPWAGQGRSPWRRERDQRDRRRGGGRSFVRVERGGDARDDLVSYEDLARGLVQLCFAPGPLLPVYHLATGVGSSLHDLADAVRRRIPAADIEIGPGFVFNGLDHNVHCVLDIDAARADIGYDPHDLGASVDAYLARLSGRA